MLVSSTLAILLSLATASNAIHAADSFSLRTLGGQQERIVLANSKATAVFFLSSVCPMSGDYSQRIASVHKEYSGKGVRLLLVNANDNETDAEVRNHASKSGLPSQLYRDKGAKVADLLKATVTPTVVLLDQKGDVRYFGAIDDSRTPDRVKRTFLRDAIEAVLQGKTVAVPHTRVLGCTIKQ